MKYLRISSFHNVFDGQVVLCLYNKNRKKRHGVNIMLMFSLFSSERSRISFSWSIQMFLPESLNNRRLRPLKEFLRGGSGGGASSERLWGRSFFREALGEELLRRGSGGGASSERLWGRGFFREALGEELLRIQFNSIQFICIAQFHKLQICLGVLYNLYT